MARFEETINIQPTTATTGAAQAALSVADTIEQFRQRTLTMAQQRAQARGEEKAAQVELQREGGVTVAPTYQKEGFVGGIEAQAHNKALRAAYLASLDTDNRENVNRILIENPDDLVAFNEAAAGYTNGVLQGVDPSVRQSVQLDLDSKIGSARNRVYAAQIEKQKNQALEAINNNIESAANQAASDAFNGDVESSANNILAASESLNQAVLAGFITDDEAEAQIREIEREASEQTKSRELSLLADVSMQDAYDKLDEMAGKVPKGWTPDEWRSFIAQEQQTLNRKNARLAKEVTVLTKEMEFAKSVARGESFMDPAIPADPAKGSQDRKDVNNAYEAIAQEWANLPAGEAYQNHVDFIKNTGIVPDKMISGINASMRSGTVDQVAVFSNLLDDIRQEPMSSNILKDVPAESKAIAMQYSESVASGIEPETALEIARKNTYGLTETEKETIKIETQAVRDKLENILYDKVGDDADFDVFVFNPPKNSAMTADFNVQFEKYMTLTGGDTEQAATLAFDGIKQTWSMTKIGGEKRYMKYAPEVFYTVPGVSNKWMTKQFKSDVEGTGMDIDDVQIAVDFDTVNSDTPSWPVMTTDEEGRMSPVFDSEGNVMRWSPDFTKTKEYVKMKALPEKRVKRAEELKKTIDTLEKLRVTKGRETGA